MQLLYRSILFAKISKFKWFCPWVHKIITFIKNPLIPTCIWWCLLMFTNLIRSNSLWRIELKNITYKTQYKKMLCEALAIFIYVKLIKLYIKFPTTHKKQYCLYQNKSVKGLLSTIIKKNLNELGGKKEIYTLAEVFYELNCFKSCITRNIFKLFTIKILTLVKNIVCVGFPWNVRSSTVILRSFNLIHKCTKKYFYTSNWVYEKFSFESYLNPISLNIDPIKLLHSVTKLSIFSISAESF